MTEYFHIINFQKQPAKGYGIAVDKGIVQSVPYDMPDIKWMIGKPVEFIKQRVGDKGVVVRINDLLQNDNNEI